MSNPWDNREKFERYVYDYLIKKGMNETAEIFRREANLPSNPMPPPAIDVPDSFLREWWLIVHDIVRAWQQSNSDNNEGCSSNAAEQMVNVRRQAEPSQSREEEMNEQMIRELTDSSNFELTIVEDLMPLEGCRLAETEQTSQGWTSSQPQKKSLTASKGFYQPVDLADIGAQGVGSSSSAVLETEKVAPNESGRKSKNSAGSEYGSNGVPVGADCPSETSSPICKSFDDVVKLTHSHAGDDKDEGKASSSNSGTNHASAGH